MQPGHSKANEEATLPSPATPERVRGASELQDEAVGEVEEKLVPVNCNTSLHRTPTKDKVNAKGVLENLRP